MEDKRLLFAIKIDCFDLNEFFSSAFVNKNSLVAVYNPYAGFELLRICKGRVMRASTFRFSDQRIIPSQGYVREAIVLPLVLYYAFSLFISVYRRYCIKAVMTDNSYIAGFIFPICKLLNIDKLVYCAHDWFVLDFRRIRELPLFIRRIFSWLVFRTSDLIATLCADIHYEYSASVIESRAKSFLGFRKIIKKEISFVGLSANEHRNYQTIGKHSKIVYLGSVPDLESFIHFLHRLENTEFQIHYAGNLNIQFLEAAHNNFKYHGFLENSDISALMRQCDFGLCVGIPGSHSERVISSKFIDYLTYDVIPIVPRFMREMFCLVDEFRVGLSEEEFVSNANADWDGLVRDAVVIRKNISSFRSARLINYFDRVL